MRTVLLDVDTWDLTLDVQGNLASVGDPYSQAQDAASELRLFRGELYYDTTQGVPYWQEILGRPPGVALMVAKFQQAAMKVPGVTNATCTITSVSNRTTTGTVLITNEAGKTARARF